MAVKKQKKTAPVKSKKPKAQPSSRKAGNRGGKSFFSVIFSTPIRQLLISVIIIVLLVVFWDSLAAFFDRLLVQFGWGILFIIAAVITVIVLAWRRRLGTLIFSWHRWIGGILILLGVWGILSTFTVVDNVFTKGLGGSFGREIVAFPNTGVIYFFRIAGLVILGIIFIAPRGTLSALRAVYSWIRDQFQRQPHAPGTRPAKRERQPATPEHRTIITQSRPTVSQKPPLDPVMNEPLIAPEVDSARKKLEELAARAAALRPPSPDETKQSSRQQKEDKPAKNEKTAQARPSGDLKQVAGDVWKKYGEASNLVVQDGWSLPPIDILDVSPEMQFSPEDNLQRAKLIEETLSSYNVDAKVVQINAGPTVTQFGVEPGWVRKYKEVKEKDRDGNIQVRLEEVSKTRVKVERISSLANDLSLALAAPTIRIEAPVPGKTYVGVEVPNVTSDMVSLRGVIETTTFQKLEAKTKMAIALGKGAGGDATSADLTKMPHLLIAGATGSGKTVCLNTIVCGLLMFNTPADLRFILIDPKRVELVQYNSIPHLATPVIVDTHKAMAALRWLCQEMDQRYKTFSSIGARNIESYNKDKEDGERMPYLVLVIDELADLMMAGFDEVETNLCRLAQLARATGIHLVVATQRPSVDVVTGLIKANFPTRISFAVTSQVDSRTILDSPGAEKLLGHGDMLYLPTDAAKPKRLQGCFLSDAEIDRLVYFWGNQQGDAVTDRLKLETLVATAQEGTIGGHPLDPLLEQAKELARQHEDVSTSFLQRRLHIGYPRAARLKEQLDAVLQQEQKAEDEESVEMEDKTDIEYGEDTE